MRLVRNPEKIAGAAVTRHATSQKFHPLNNRGIGVFDEEDFEEEEILIPK